MHSVLASSIAGQVASWHDFYTLAGGIAATLLGLVFVAMSLHADPAGREVEFERALWGLAAGVLAMFADVVLIAFVFLVPDQSALGVGIPVLVLGALAFLVDLVATFSVRMVISSARWRFATPLLGCLLQTLAGVGIIAGQPMWLEVLAVAMGVLLVLALLASWLLLSEPTLAALKTNVPPASPPTV